MFCASASAAVAQVEEGAGRDRGLEDVALAALRHQALGERARDRGRRELARAGEREARDAEVAVRAVLGPDDGQLVRVDLRAGEGARGRDDARAQLALHVAGAHCQLSHLA